MGKSLAWYPGSCWHLKIWWHLSFLISTLTGSGVRVCKVPALWRDVLWGSLLPASHPHPPWMAPSWPGWCWLKVSQPHASSSGKQRLRPHAVFLYHTALKEIPTVITSSESVPSLFTHFCFRDFLFICSYFCLIWTLFILHLQTENEFLSKVTIPWKSEFWAERGARTLRTAETPF